MLEYVSWNEVIKPVKAQLDARLRKVVVYPQLIYSCQHIAENLRLLKTLKEKGAEPVLFDQEDKKSYSIHGIEKRYWKLFKLCRSLRLDFYNVKNNVIAVSNISHRKKLVGISLGERQPFLSFSTDPLTLTPQEFRKLVEEINNYGKKLGIWTKPFHREWRSYDEFHAVTYTTKFAPPYCQYEIIYDIMPFAEEYVDIIAPPPQEKLEEERKKKEEEKKKREAYMRHVENMVPRMEKLIVSAKTIASSDNVTVYDADIPSAEKIFKMRLSDVAEKAVVVVSDSYVMNTVGLSARLPLNYLVANRILEERGVTSFFMTPDEKYRKMFPKPIGISVQYVTPSGSVKLYCLLIYPKPFNQLPRIQTAKVIMTKKRIVVINP